VEMLKVDNPTARRFYVGFTGNESRPLRKWARVFPSAVLKL
jgi:hypothetical protein